MSPHTKRFFRVLLHCLLPTALCPLLHGCNVLGAAAQLAPPPTVPAQYKGLAGQKIGVMVYADKGTLYDFPTLRQDLANGVQNKLMQGIRGKEKLLEGVGFPYPPAKFVKYQENYPEIEASPPTAYAPNFTGLTRLIYLDIESFATRSDEAPELYRGSCILTMKVIEIAPDRTAKVVYDEPSVRTVYPSYVPAEGLPSGNDRVIYGGTIDAASSDVALRFIPHPENDR